MLETIWFVVWGLLWAIYFTLDGFDLGMGTLLPFLARNDEEKRVIYNAAGPYWDGNEVWLITAGGVTFAAFPKAYAVMFSALYAPLLILLYPSSFATKGRTPAGKSCGTPASFSAVRSRPCCSAWPSPTCSWASPLTAKGCTTATF